MADITEQLAERTRLLHVAEDEIDRLRARVAELEAAKGEPVAFLHQVVCGDGEPDQALSFEPDNFPLAGTLGYRSLSHEPLFRATLNNEMERLRTELGRAYRALHAFAFADRDGKRLNETAVMYHSPTIGAAARFVHEGALDGSEYFIWKTVDVLHAALRGEQPLPANTELSRATK